MYIAQGTGLCAWWQPVAFVRARGNGASSRARAQASDMAPRGALLQGTFSVAAAVLISGGLVQGGTALEAIVSAEGAFAWKCGSGSTSDAKCAARSDALSNVVFYGYLGLTIGQLLLGMVLDRAGPRLAGSVGLLLSIAGFLLLGYAPLGDEAANHWGDESIKWSMMMIAFGGCGPYLAGMCIGNVFAKPTLFVGLQTGGFILAGWVFLGIQELADVWPDVRFFYIMAGVAVVFFVGVLLLFPPTPYEVGDAPFVPVLHGLCGPSGASLDTSTRLLSGGDGRIRKRRASSALRNQSLYRDDHAALATSGDGLEAGSAVHELRAVADQAEASGSVWTELCQVHYAFFAFFFGVNLLGQTFYASTVRDQLAGLGDSGAWTDRFDILSNLGFIANPFIGNFLKRQFGFAGAFSAAILFNLISIAGNFVESLPFQLVTFSALALGRSFLFSALYAYGAVGFNAKHYGAVIGFCSAWHRRYLAATDATANTLLAVSAVLTGFLMGLVVPSMIHFSNTKGFQVTNIVLLVALTLTTVFPVSVYNRSKPQRLDSIIEFRGGDSRGDRC